MGVVLILKWDDKIEHMIPLQTFAESIHVLGTVPTRADKKAAFSEFIDRLAEKHLNKIIIIVLGFNLCEKAKEVVE